MKTNSILLSVIIGAAIAAPIAATPSGYGVARADELPMPRNQSEFDQFAARLDNAAEAERVAQLNRAGNAFDNGQSRLFWFTDLDAARAQAKREGKPILSLRLLGNLSDELSCANSRLFRVLLYPNAEINRQLRENFVLHWSRERPVSVATIDMGDGRILKRTLTGNSAHYLLSAEGQPLDALPGLYAPAEFAAWLQRGADFARDWRAMQVDLQPKMLGDWHRGRLVDILKIEGSFLPIEEAERVIAANVLMNDNFNEGYTNARAASGLTAPKRTMEIPVLNAIEQTPANVLRADIRLLSDNLPTGTLFRSRTLDENLNPKPTGLDAATRARIIAMQPGNDVRTLIETLQRNLARDTQNNRRNFEPAIHAYFVNQSSPDSADDEGFPINRKRTNLYLSNEAKASLIKSETFGVRKSAHFGEPAPTLSANREIAAEAKPNFDKLNRAIYDKLFRTPASDPWLGLAPADAFVALQNGGVQDAQTQQRTTQTP